MATKVKLRQRAISGNRQSLYLDFYPAIPRKQITQSSARAYYNKFKAALKQAYKKGLIEKDLSTRIDGISEPEVQREYLTLEQLQALVNTPCSIPLLKNAFEPKRRDLDLLKSIVKNG